MQVANILAHEPCAQRWLVTRAEAERRTARPLEKRTYVRGTLVKLKRAGNRR
jgi:hypothetical protein